MMIDGCIKSIIKTDKLALDFMYKCAKCPTPNIYTVTLYNGDYYHTCKDCILKEISVEVK